MPATRLIQLSFPFCLELEYLLRIRGLLKWWSDKESSCQRRRHRDLASIPWVRKIPWRRKWQPTPVFLLGKSHGQRSLADYSPWDRKELETTEWLHFLSFYGEEYEVSFKIRNKTTTWPNHPTTGHKPLGNHNWIRHMCSSVHCRTIYNR